MEGHSDRAARFSVPRERGENVEPAVDDAGLGSGVQASSGDVSIGDAVLSRSG